MLMVALVLRLPSTWHAMLWGYSVRYLFTTTTHTHTHKLLHAYLDINRALVNPTLAEISGVQLTSKRLQQLADFAKEPSRDSGLSNFSASSLRGRYQEGLAVGWLPRPTRTSTDTRPISRPSPCAPSSTPT